MQQAWISRDYWQQLLEWICQLALSWQRWPAFKIALLPLQRAIKVWHQPVETLQPC